MTVVHPNHIVGINSITVQTGDSLSVHKADGSLIRTIVSNTGVIASDVSNSGAGRQNPGGCSYGGDKGIFAYGYQTGGSVSMSNLVSNVGVVGSDVSGVGTAREVHNGACEYGQDKGIYAYGGGPTNVSNLVSNVGVISADVTGVGTSRHMVSGCSFN